MKYDCKITFQRSVLIFVLVAAFLVFEMAVQVSPGIMTHELMRDLSLNASQLGLMSGCYFFTYTLMQIPAGLLYDRFNVRYVIILPLLVCAFGVLMFGLSQGFWFSAATRVLMGTGSAFAFIGVLVVAADIFPAKYFALLAGLTQMLAAFGAMGGQLPLLWMVHALGWRHAMFCLAAIGCVLALLIYLFVCYHKCPGVITHHEHHRVMASMKIILSKAQTWWVALYACCMWAPMAAFASLWGLPYLLAAFPISKTYAAGSISLMWLGLAICSPLLGWWSDRLHQRRILLLLAAVLACVGFAWVLMPAFLPVMLVSIVLFIVGAACAGQALSFAVVRDNNEERHRAAAIGFNNMAVVIAGAVFQPLIGHLMILHARLAGDNFALYHAADYRSGLSVLLISLLLAVCVALFLIRKA